MTEHNFFAEHFDVLFGTLVAVMSAAFGLLWRKFTQQEINIKRLDHLEKAIDEIKSDLKEDMKKGDSDHAKIWAKASELDSRLSSVEAKIDILLERSQNGIQKNKTY